MRRALAALVALALLAGAFPPVMGAAAQGAPGASSASSLDEVDVHYQTEGAAPDGGNSSEETEVVAQVDDAIAITGYEYDQENETMLVTLRNTGDAPRSVTVTEIVSSEDASGARSSLRFGIGIFEIDPSAGETTVRVDVRARGDMAGVTVTTQASARAGHGEALMVDLNPGGSLISGPPTAAQVRAGAIAGGVGSIVIVVLGAWQYVATKNEDVKDADLSPRLSLLGRFRE